MRPHRSCCTSRVDRGSNMFLPRSCRSLGDSRHTTTSPVPWNIFLVGRACKRPSQLRRSRIPRDTHSNATGIPRPSPISRCPGDRGCSWTSRTGRSTSRVGTADNTLTPPEQTLLWGTCSSRIRSPHLGMRRRFPVDRGCSWRHRPGRSTNHEDSSSSRRSHLCCKILADTASSLIKTLLAVHYWQCPLDREWRSWTPGGSRPRSWCTGSIPRPQQ